MDRVISLARKDRLVGRYIIPIWPVSVLTVIFFLIGYAISRQIFGDNPIVFVTSGIVSASVAWFLLLRHEKRARQRCMKEIRELKETMQEYVLNEKLVDARAKTRRGVIGTVISLVTVFALLGYIMVYKESSDPNAVLLFLGACIGLFITLAYGVYYADQVKKYEAVHKGSES